VPVGGRHGVQLENVEPRSFLVKLGLKSGDVLLKVNGIAVTDPEKLPDLTSAAEGNEITVSFSRSDVGLTLARRLQ
jgi:S1-C subfamily serine protease